MIFLNPSKGQSIISSRRDSLSSSLIISASRANLTLAPLSKTKSLSTLDFLLKANIRFQDISTIRASQFHPNSCVNLTTNIELLPATIQVKHNTNTILLNIVNYINITQPNNHTYLSSCQYSRVKLQKSIFSYDQDKLFLNMKIQSALVLRGSNLVSIYQFL
ncbi:Hypothetical_protein [Hexamita inflata]|uniref:Hypothetical_protein n=1 Tax=Hexamita inflata TaxID=28002 RepID=A0AA86NUV6_9EUKA|nr:Hypothetical protein HINF_LOCUS13100 [Hexamita inflata]